MSASASDGRPDEAHRDVGCDTLPQIPRLGRGACFINETWKVIHEYCNNNDRGDGQPTGYRLNECTGFHAIFRSSDGDTRIKGYLNKIGDFIETLNTNGPRADRRPRGKTSLLYLNNMITIKLRHYLGDFKSDTTILKVIRDNSM